MTDEELINDQLQKLQKKAAEIKKRVFEFFPVSAQEYADAEAAYENFMNKQNIETIAKMPLSKKMFIYGYFTARAEEGLL